MDFKKQISYTLIQYRFQGKVLNSSHFLTITINTARLNLEIPIFVIYSHIQWQAFEDVFLWFYLNFRFFRFSGGDITIANPGIDSDALAQSTMSKSTQHVFYAKMKT